MKALVGAFNQEKALVGALLNLRKPLFNLNDPSIQHTVVFDKLGIDLSTKFGEGPS